MLILCIEYMFTMYGTLYSCCQFEQFNRKKAVAQKYKDKQDR